MSAARAGAMANAAPASDSPINLRILLSPCERRESRGGRKGEIKARSRRILAIPATRVQPSDAEALAWRRDLGDEVANELLVRQWRQRHLARLEPGGAGVDRLAVELDHALLARVGVDAGEADRKRG